MKRILFWVWLWSMPAFLQAQTTYTVSGKVTLEKSGQAIASTLIIVYDSAMKWVASVFTDPNGMYTVSNLKAGDYYLKADGAIRHLMNGELKFSYPYLSKFYPDADDIESAVPLRVTQNLTARDFILSYGGGLSGKITRSWDGQPVAHTIIKLRDLVPSQPRCSTVTETDQEGNFFISGLIRGTRARLYCEGRVTDRSTGTLDFISLYYPRFYPGEADADLLVLDSVVTVNPQLSSIWISGRVTNSADGRPVAGMTVEAVNHNLSVINGLNAPAITDENGRYLIAGLPPGSYYIRATGLIDQSKVYETEYWPEAATPQTASRILAEVGEYPAIDFTVGRGGSISGTVRDTNGAFIGRTEIVVYDLLWQEQGRTLSDAASGDYTVGGLADGSYYVAATGVVAAMDGTTSVRYDPQYYHQADSRSGAQCVHLVGFAPQIDFALTSRGLFSLSGTVKDASSGQPIAGPDVILYDSTWQVVERKPVGNFETIGQYQFELQAGDYYIEVIGLFSTWSGTRHNLADQFYAGATSRSRATLVHLTQNAVIDFLLTPGRSLSGILCQQGSGAPIRDAMVEIYDGEGRPRGGAYGETRTAADGTFRFEGLAAEKYYLYASGYALLPDNHNERLYLPAFYPTAATWQQAELLDLTAGSKADLRFCLAEGLSISGAIRRQQDNTPIGGAFVELLDESFNRIVQVETDDQGFYSFRSISPGRYYVFANGMLRNQGGIVTQFISRYYPDAENREAAQLVELSDSPVSRIDLSLIEGLTVSGRLQRKKDHLPLAGVTVELLDSQFERIKSTLSNGTGEYRLEGLRPGRYYLFVPGLVWSPQGGDQLYIPVFYPESRNQEGAQLLTLQDFSQAGLDFLLQKGSFIAGRVRRKSDNLPIVRARIELLNSNFDPVQTVESDQQGAYQLTGLDSGRYYVFATGHVETQNGPSLLYTGEYYPGTTDRAAAQAFVLEDTLVAGIDFALSSGAGVNGYITDPLGQPVAGMVINLRTAPSWDFLAQTNSDESGFFQFSALPPGEYYVVATGWVWTDGGTLFLYPETIFPGTRERSAALTVQVSQDATVTADIRMLQGYIISGEVRRHDTNMPIGSSLVRLYDAQWKPAGEISTDNWGRYHFAVSNPGLYYVEFTGRIWWDFGGYGDWKPVYRARFYPGVYDSCEALAINLQDRVDQVNGLLKELDVGVGNARETLLPTQAALLPSYPNPFNAQTSIPFVLPNPGQAAVQIHSLQGDLIRSLVSGHHDAGSHHVIWDGRDDQGRAVASGIYIAVLRFEALTQSHKMLLLR